MKLHFMFYEYTCLVTIKNADYHHEYDNVKRWFRVSKLELFILRFLRKDILESTSYDYQSEMIRLRYPEFLSRIALTPYEYIISIEFLFTKIEDGIVSVYELNEEDILYNLDEEDIRH